MSWLPVPLRRALLGLRGRLWDHSLLIRRPLWRARAILAAIRSRALRRDAPPRVLTLVGGGTPREALPHPAVSVVVDAASAEQARLALEAQTECSWTNDPGVRAPYCWNVDPGAESIARLPPTHLESMLMAAAAEDLSVVASGPMSLDDGGPGMAAQRASCWQGTARGAHLLLQAPEADQEAREVVGRVVPHISDSDLIGSGLELGECGVLPAGDYLLHPDVRGRTAVRSRVREIDQVLRLVPESPGPRSVIFLLPYLAVGGAEKLLFDLLQGLGTEVRAIVVTTEEHRAELGQTVSRCRTLTPHVYTLGDWLPRQAHESAIRHLIRRYQVESLFCWNGSTCFYDLAPRLRQSHPELRVVNQLFNHAGGWIEHYGPRLVSSIDLHVAVNTVIASALVHERCVRDEAVVTIHHGVHVPLLSDPVEEEGRRRRCRRELGIPEQAVVVGTFVRMSEQKRPLDVIALARRMTGGYVHFLLVGGGPLDRAVDAELARRPTPNLSRLPLQQDAVRLYDAVDVCLMTSEYEGLPVFLLDGMARSKPAVAPDVGDIRLLLEKGGGVVVPRPGDLDALEAAIRLLESPDKRASEGRLARQRIETSFGLDRYVEAYRGAILADPRSVPRAEAQRGA